MTKEPHPSRSMRFALLAAAPQLGKPIASFKSFTARRIIDRPRERGSPVLDLLAWHKTRHRADREHQVWQEGPHPEMIQGEAMMRQTLDDIHNNPVARGYVDDPLHGRCASARTYAAQEGLIEVVTLSRARERGVRARCARFSR